MENRNNYVNREDKISVQVKIFQELAIIAHERENFREALRLIHKVLKVDPQNSDSLQDEPFLQEQMEEKKERLNYYRACRGEKLMSDKTEGQLKCYFHKNKSSYLKLMRIKVEEVYKDPHILLFIDILSDRESEHLIRRSKKFKVSSYGEGQTVDYRISQISLIHWSLDKVVEGIYRRIEAVTGLDLLNGAELAYIASYGIDGYLSAHFDSISDETNPESYRTATWMHYMSEVRHRNAIHYFSYSIKILLK